MNTGMAQGIAGFAVAGITARIARSGTPPWDAAVFRSLNGLPDALAPIAWVPMQAGALASPLAAGAGIAWRGDRRRGLRIAATGATAWGGAKVLKRAVGRGRPGDHLDDVTLRLGSADVGLGFPSGHAAVAAGIAASWGADRTAIRVGLASLAGTVGLARIYVGAHYPLDVLGGWAMGLALGEAVRYLDATVARPPSGG